LKLGQSFAELAKCSFFVVPQVQVGVEAGQVQLQGRKNGLPACRTITMIGPRKLPRIAPTVKSARITGHYPGYKVAGWTEQAHRSSQDRKPVKLSDGGTKKEIIHNVTAAPTKSGHPSLLSTAYRPSCRRYPRTLQSLKMLNISSMIFTSSSS
jgi:hypothetical protein